MTLTELAKKLRKILRFRWLTLDKSRYITLWNRKPYWDEYDSWSIGLDISHICYAVVPPAMCGSLDLSEYTGKNGRIVYSECIVEVEQ